jgi:hypothetical protein
LVDAEKATINAKHKSSKQDKRLQDGDSGQSAKDREQCTNDKEHKRESVNCNLKNSHVRTFLENRNRLR